MAARVNITSAPERWTCQFEHDNWSARAAAARCWECRTPMEALSGDALGLETPCSPPAAAIVVTPPSSPDDPSRPPPKLLRTPPLPALKPLPVLSDRMHSAPFDSTPLSPAPFFALDPGMPSFQERLATSSLPPPGADHFAARRALWLSPGPSPPRPTEANPSRQKLEALLTSPNALEDDQIWDTGVNKVWRGLIGGARLKRRLPLALVVSVFARMSYPRDNSHGLHSLKSFKLAGSEKVHGRKAHYLPNPTSQPML